MTIFKPFHCPRIGSKYKIFAKGERKWTVKISVMKNDGFDYHCYECGRLIEIGEIQGRKAGDHFCIDCISYLRIQEDPIQ